MFPLAASDPETSPSPSLSSLPNEILLDVLARVPKRYYPILSCVCKEFRNLVRSREIHRTRSLHGKDSLYICFVHNRGWRRSHRRRNWFILRRNEKNPTTTENLFSSAADNFSEYPDSIFAVGPEIFLIHGSSLWIYDSISGKYSQGPSMKAELVHPSVGLVGDKIYVIGVDRNKENQAEFFDLKTRTWKAAPVLEGKSFCTWSPRRTVALDRKFFALGGPSCTDTCSYDTRDGSCRSGFVLADENWRYAGVCVMENVLYAYYSSLGLMWYDSKLTRWRLVDGLDRLDEIRTVGLAEYYGKLAFMWVEWDGVSETKEVWCRMIALKKSEVGIHGNAEPSQLLGIVPRYYALRKCLSLVD